MSRSKSDVAMVNEVSAKVVCHNICCLIQETYELGIVATFWASPTRQQDQQKALAVAVK